MTNPVLNQIPCIRCGFIIERLYQEDDGHLPARPNQMWNDGVVIEAFAGYGSTVDGNVYLLAVCDKCLKDHAIKVGEYL